MRSLFSITAVLQLLLLSVQALHPDEARKYDWYMRNIGGVSTVPEVLSNGDVFVGTDEGVIAVINSATGLLNWRTILSPKTEVVDIDVIGKSNVGLVQTGKGQLLAVDLGTGSIIRELVNSKVINFDICQSPATKHPLIHIGTVDGHYIFDLDKSEMKEPEETDKEPVAVSCFLRKDKPATVYHNDQLADASSVFVDGEAIYLRVAENTIQGYRMKSKEALPTINTATAEEADFILRELKMPTLSAGSEFEVLEKPEKFMKGKHVYSRKVGENMKLEIDFDDLTLRMKKGSKVLWTREESLSKPAQVVTLTEPRSGNGVSVGGLMDIIPTSSAELQVLLGRVSDWFDGKVASIGRKEKVQKAPVARERIINGIVVGRQPGNEGQLANLIGPHLKLAVVLSETGKLFSIDLSTSEILWSKMEEKDCIIDRVKNGPKIWLRVSHSNGKYDYIEPATGEIAESGSLPASSVGHTYSLNGTDFIGYFEGKEAWTVRFNDESERLVSIIEPQQDYFGHVPVVVKSDASVLYRYINSNLIGVVTENAQGYVIVRMVDSVTGALVYETKIPHASDPLMVIFDNSAVVYYRNENAKRYELLVVDLFKDREDFGFWDTMRMSKAAKAADGAIEGNATRVSAYALEMPIAATQQFVFPQAVISLGVSTTQKGVTPRSVFFGLASGKVLAVNKDTVLNPRRQTVKPVSDRSSRLQNVAADKDHDASVPPYTPLVPIKSTDIVTYDNEVEDIKFIRTTPTHFESTSLLVVIGLDMYMSPTNTAQRYDLLGPDFDYPLLTISIAVVLATIVITTRMSSRKALENRWK